MARNDINISVYVSAFEMLRYFEQQIQTNKQTKKTQTVNAMAYINLVLDGSKLLLSSSQLCIGLAQSLTLRLHLTVNLIELDNV